jgi:hypothetical protein
MPSPSAAEDVEPARTVSGDLALEDQGLSISLTARLRFRACPRPQPLALLGRQAEPKQPPGRAPHPTPAAALPRPATDLTRPANCKQKFVFVSSAKSPNRDKEAYVTAWHLQLNEAPAGRLCADHVVLKSCCFQSINCSFAP